MKISEQADLFDVSVSSIKNNWKENGYPIKGSLKEQVLWVRQNRPLASEQTLTDARRENISLKNRILEFEFLVRQGQLIERREVLNLFLGRISIVKSGLLNLHRTLIHQLVGHDEHEWSGIIRKACIELLEKFSRRSAILREGKNHGGVRRTRRH